MYRSNIESIVKKTTLAHKLRYTLTIGTVIGFFGLAAFTPNASWSQEPQAQLTFTPGETPSQEVISAAVEEAAIYIESLEAEKLPEPEPEPEVEAEEPEEEPVEESIPPLTYTGGGSPEVWMAAAGIAPSDWGYVDFIASRESGWNPNATNPSSGACGLIQANPCSKVPGSGYDPVDNLRWANGYATGRYGSWAAAYDFWVSNNWW